MSKVKTFGLAAIFIAILVNCAAAQKLEDVAKSFSFDESRMDSGTLYRYVISDLEGKGAMDFYVYIDSKRSLQTMYNAYPSGFNAILLNAMTVDPVSVMFSAMNQVNLLPAKDKSFKTVSMRLDTTKRKLSYESVVINGGKETTQRSADDIPFLPIYYNFFDGADVAFAFRFVKADALKFRVGVNYSGRFVEYVVTSDKDETVAGVPCRKYKLEAQGLLAAVVNPNGAVWVAKDDPTHFIVKHTLNVRKSWSMPNFQLMFVERKPITDADWKSLQADLVAKQESELTF